MHYCQIVRKLPQSVNLTGRKEENLSCTFQDPQCMFIILCPTLLFDLECKLVGFAWNRFLLLQTENAKWVSKIMTFIEKRDHS